MFKLKLLLFVMPLIVFLTSCQPNSRSANSNPKARKTEANRTCVPESELLSANISGGNTVQPQDIDSNAVIMLVSGGQLCTAAAIDKRVLLTAAHCIAGNRSNTYASFYASVSCESGYNKNKHIKGIVETIVHEEFDSSAKPDEMKADIALVILEEDIPAEYAVYNIADPAQLVDSSELYLYGYGRTGSNTGGAGILRRATIDRQHFEINFSKNKIKINQTAGSGICQGDSGGPALVKINGEYQILGVNSYVVGPENDICSKYSYQTLISTYKDWINYKLLAYKK